MERPLTEKEKETIINLGALQYPSELCALVLEDNVPDHKDFAMLYQRGEVRGQYKIDLKLLEMAQQGDLKATAKLEQRQRALKMKK